MKRQREEEEAHATDSAVTGEDEDVDVETFFARDCDAACQQLHELAEKRCNELQREFDKAKEGILKAIATPKETLSNEEEAEVAIEVYDVIVQVIAGPYKGNSYILNIDLDHPKCLIGRSTGRKFRIPRGLSFRRDSEVSTTHGQLRLKDGQILYTDLDSTNGSYINDAEIDPQTPTPLSLTDPSVLYIGGTEMQLTIVKRHA